MNIEGMTNLEKSVAASRLVPDWQVRPERGYYAVYEMPGRLQLFVLTEANNFYGTGAVNSPGLYHHAWPVINQAKAAGASLRVNMPTPEGGTIHVLGAPISQTVPLLLDQILEAVEDGE